MGHEVEAMAKARGHEPVCIVDVDNLHDFDSEKFRTADVAIEFSTPDSAWGNIRRCAAAGVPVVSGTTGWQTEPIRAELNALCSRGLTLLWSPNFSIGLNVALAASHLLARLLSPYSDYRANIHEIHHVHKKDHPSGTAILLADSIVQENGRYGEWAEPQEGKVPEGALPVTHERIGEVPGVHDVVWDSPADTITLRHEAKGRKGFALGAVVAAEWLLKAPKGKMYNMNDVLKAGF